MKGLRIIRMMIAVVFLAATVAYFITADLSAADNFKAARVYDSLQGVEKAQVIPSTIALCMGALLFWLCITAFFGRFYCSTVCPVGTFSDLFMRLRREIGKLFPKRFGRRFRWKEANRWRYQIMAAYFICLVIGIMAVPFIVEPWNIVRNFASVFDPGATATTWSVLGSGLAVGMAAGVVMLVIVAVWGFACGRDYCNIICPLGQAMGIFDRYQLTHIELNPDKCISCMQCEWVCRSSCIKVSERRVDNSRCVRCLDCIAKCPTGAIRLQSNRNRAATPLVESRE